MLKLALNKSMRASYNEKGINKLQPCKEKKNKKKWPRVKNIKSCHIKKVWKFHIFIASKEGLSLDIRLLQKALKDLLWNIYLRLEPLYKRNLLITAAVDGSFFLKKKILRKRLKKISLWSGITINETMINTKAPFLYGWKVFWTILHRKWFC